MQLTDRQKTGQLYHIKSLLCLLHNLRYDIFPTKKDSFFFFFFFFLYFHKNLSCVGIILTRNIVGENISFSQNWRKIINLISGTDSYVQIRHFFFSTENNNFLISPWKLMIWALIRNDSVRYFLCVHKKNIMWMPPHTLSYGNFNKTLS